MSYGKYVKGVMSMTLTLQHGNIYFVMDIMSMTLMKHGKCVIDVMGMTLMTFGPCVKDVLYLTQSNKGYNEVSQW